MFNWLGRLLGRSMRKESALGCRRNRLRSARSQRSQNRISKCDREKAGPRGSSSRLPRRSCSPKLYRWLSRVCGIINEFAAMRVWVQRPALAGPERALCRRTSLASAMATTLPLRAPTPHMIIRTRAVLPDVATGETRACSGMVEAASREYRPKPEVQLKGLRWALFVAFALSPSRVPLC